jgi:hypothetical protein
VLILLGVASSASAQAPVSLIAKVNSQVPLRTSVDVVLLESTPRTIPLVVVKGQDSTFDKEEVGRDSKGLNWVLWLLFFAPDLVAELQKRGLDDTRQIVLSDDARLQIRYGRNVSIVVDFETNQLTRLEVSRDGHLWTAVWDDLEKRHQIRVMRDSAPFAMIAPR